jgi:hypothetical protein
VSDTQPISKRSKRILEETQRHLRFACRGIDLLSVDEYDRLRSVVTGLYDSVDLPLLMSHLRQLEHVLRQSLIQRS